MTATEDTKMELKGPKSTSVDGEKMLEEDVSMSKCKSRNQANKKG